MAGAIIMFIVLLGSAILFYGIGVHAQKREQPMAFWSGSEVKASEITDVTQYNRENGIMWKQYSLWYIAGAIAQIWSTIAATVLLVLSCTVGLALLILHYNRIYRRYKVK